MRLNTEKRIVFIGDLFIDCVAFINDESLSALSFTKGERVTRPLVAINQLLETLDNTQMCIGGSVINSACVYASLDGGADIVTAIPDDMTGTWAIEELVQAGVHLLPYCNKTAMMSLRKCLSLVTPDGERTMIVSDGAKLDDAPFVYGSVSALDPYAVFLSSYLFRALGAEAVLGMVRQFVSDGRCVYFSLSDKSIVQDNREIILSIISAGASVFCNQQEYDALVTGVAGGGIQGLLALNALFVVTLGSHGSRILTKDQTVDVPAQINAPARNATGAGDHYAGAFLAAHMLGADIYSCATFASMVAGRKVACVNPRLGPHDFEELKANLLQACRERNDWNEYQGGT